MRTDAKVGILFGVVLVVAAIVYFANNMDNSGDELADYGPPATATPTQLVDPEKKPEPGPIVKPEFASEPAPEPKQEPGAEPAPVSDVAPELAPESKSIPRAEPADTRPQYYTVKKGDTLYNISKQVYGEGKYWNAIYRANKNLITNPARLRPAWKLKLPRPEELAD